MLSYTQRNPQFQIQLLSNCCYPSTSKPTSVYLQDPPQGYTVLFQMWSRNKYIILSLFQYLKICFQISWIRLFDYHILSTGLSMYTRNSRYSVHHSRYRSVWTLQIRVVQLQDQGEYMCQAATSTGLRTISYWLVVHTPRAAILGSREKHVTLRDSITLSCELRDSVAQPEFVFWYHNHVMTNHLPGITVTTSVIGPDPDSLWVAQPNTTVSRLTISQTRHHHTGNYTCAPTLAMSDSVRLFVSQGKLYYILYLCSNPGHE